MIFKIIPSNIYFDLYEKKEMDFWEGLGFKFEELEQPHPCNFRIDESQPMERYFDSMHSLKYFLFTIFPPESKPIVKIDFDRMVIEISVLFGVLRR